MTLISIIIPVYNCSKYINKCIDSIINQKGVDYEILLIDDGSTDSSGNICDLYAKKHKNIMVYHKENEGVSAARNTGIDKCRGEYITFVDSDDFLEPNALSLKLKKLIELDVDIVIGSFNKFSSEGDLITPIQNTDGDSLLDANEIVEYTISYLRNPRKKQMLMSCWGKLFRMSIIEKNSIRFDTSLHNAEDLDFNFNYLSYVKSALFIEQTVYNYQKNMSYTSLSTRIPENPRKLFGCLDVLSRIRNFADSHNPGRDIEKDLAHFYVYQSVLFMIRVCGQVNSENKKMLIKFIKNFINEPEFIDKIRNYVPAEGNYRIIPMLMKFRFTWVLMKICNIEARRLYKSF
jgi:glycosyltransferase involved in cell wall biosynthesis